MSPETTLLLLDVMLGGLVAPLRMVGYDTAYALERDVETDPAVRKLASIEGRHLLTRDRELALQAEPSSLLTATDPHDQLAELADRGFELELTDPQRCSRCNGRLRSVSEGPGPADGPDPGAEPVWQCRDCTQYFWKGSHWENLAARLETL